MPRTLLITGATGQQGGATIGALSQFPSSHDFDLIALTRNTTSESAQKLRRKYPNVKLIQGDLDNPDAVFKSAGTAIWGVFSVQNPFGGKGASIQSEERQGKALVDAAIVNNVKHFVYASVDRGGAKSDNNDILVPHFASKAHIEKCLKQKSSGSGMTYTILRPVFFMENLAEDMQGKLVAAAWRRNVGEKPLQLVATSDIAFFAARAFAKHDQFAGKAISIAGDQLTFKDAQAVYAKRSGHSMQVGFGSMAWALLKAVKELGLMFEWFHDVGYGADIEGLRVTHSKLMDFGTWVASNRKS